MHPNTFLRTLWRRDVRLQVFVAIQFDKFFNARYDSIIAPAIGSVTVNGTALNPFRVDLSRSGDSILTEINDGIAHSVLVVADISAVARGNESDVVYRNGNVMYEVGIALACRQPSEVLLIRDDDNKLLFDVSTIPVKRIDFNDARRAIETLAVAVNDRLIETNYVFDARARIALSELTGGEISILRHIASLGTGKAWGNDTHGDVTGVVSIPRLLDKKLIAVAGMFKDAGKGEYPAYALTRFGWAVNSLVAERLPRYNADSMK